MDLNKLVVRIKNHLGRPLNDSDVSVLKNYITENPIGKYTSINLYIDYHFNKIVDNMRIAKNNTIEGFTSLNEVKETKGMLYLDSVLRDIPGMSLSKKLNMSTRTRYNYIMFDSNNCSEITNDRNKFKWLLNDGNPVYQTGYINLFAKLKNIKMARIGRITFDSMPLEFIDLALSRTRLGIEFEEFSSQALISPSGVKYQFVSMLNSGDTNTGPNVTFSSFFQNRGWFRFREMFTVLDTLTLNIWDTSTETKIQLIDDYVSVVATQQDFNVTVELISINNPVDYSYAYYLKNAQGGLRFSDFTTDDPIPEAAIITEYNSVHNLMFRTGSYFNPPSPVGTLFGPKPITITLLNKPRFVGVLELISENDDDDEINLE